MTAQEKAYKDVMMIGEISEALRVENSNPTNPVIIDAPEEALQHESMVNETQETQVSLQSQIEPMEIGPESPGPCVRSNEKSKMPTNDPRPPSAQLATRRPPTPETSAIYADIECVLENKEIIVYDELAMGMN